MDEMFDVSPDSLEASIAEMNSVDEFNSSVDFEKFIVLNKKELSNFCRLVEPLTKSTSDDYGKSVFLRCIGNDKVEISYLNTPYKISAILNNKSGKQVRPFAVFVNTLKKLVTSAFASLILVEENGDINIALCESLLYLDTKALNPDLYNFTRGETVNSIDKEIALYTFKKIGVSLSLTERASEKTIVIKDKKAYFNTGLFASCSVSPFGGDESFVLYKQVSDVLSVLSEVSKNSLKYSISGETLYVTCDDNYYAEVQVGSEEKVKSFLIPSAVQSLNFNANIVLINDNLIRLLSVVKSLDYLSDILTLSFSKEFLTLEVASSNLSKKTEYKFPIVEGSPDVIGSTKLTVEVFQMFLQIVGSDVKYSFSDSGIGIVSPLGKFLIRKS